MNIFTSVGRFPFRQLDISLVKTIFAVLAAEHPAKLGPVIQRTFGSDSLELQPGEWLISAEGTTQGVCERIGVVKRNAEGNLVRGDIGGALVVAISAYYGVKSSDIWEWVRAHWESA